MFYSIVAIFVGAGPGTAASDWENDTAHEIAETIGDADESMETEGGDGGLAAKRRGVADKDTASGSGAAYSTRPDAEIAAHLGEVLWSMNLRDEANAAWAKGLELNRDNDTLKSTILRLRGSQ